MSVFVFGSNRRGIHGAGAAHHALIYHGAQPYKGEGYYGNSYALPTKDQRIHTLGLPEITKHVDKFLAFARSNPQLEFKVTRIGCGLAGYRDQDIAPMFKLAPNNCTFDSEWKYWLGDDFTYWGSQ